MTNAQRSDHAGFRFEFDMGDRLDKAMRVAGLSIDDMAAALDVSRGTIGNYRSGRTEPSKLQVKEWAIRTGAPYEWLMTGEVGPAGIEPTTSTVKSQQFGPDHVAPVISLFADRALPAGELA